MPRAPYKYRGPETWARIRELYLAGTPGPTLARQFDVGLGNLRRRATQEGWSRRLANRWSEAPNVRWSAPAPGARPSPARRAEMTVERFQATWPELWDALIAIAHEVALEALTDPADRAGPLGDWAYRWRARHLGPACAADDARRARARPPTPSPPHPAPSSEDAWRRRAEAWAATEGAEAGTATAERGEGEVDA